MDIPEIGELWSALAIDAVNVQLRFDRYFGDELQSFLRSAGEPQSSNTGGFPVQSAPRRLHVARFEVNVLVAISTAREEGFAIRALPLNAGFFSRTRATVSKQSKVRISVEQVPPREEQLSWPTNMRAT